MTTLIVLPAGRTRLASLWLAELARARLHAGSLVALVVLAAATAMVLHAQRRPDDGGYAAGYADACCAGPPGTRDSSPPFVDVIGAAAPSTPQ